MIRESQHLTGIERRLGGDDVIVTKTNLKGHIIYANDVFLRISALTERDALGKPHNIIRHPHMPRAVFDLLWKSIAVGEEVFAYVVNRAMNGDHYWVFAHVTPTVNTAGDITSYNSFRRAPDIAVVSTVIQPLYQKLLAEEQRHVSPRDGLEASSNLLHTLLRDKGQSYAEFIFSLVG